MSVELLSDQVEEVIKMEESYLEGVVGSLYYVRSHEISQERDYPSFWGLTRHRRIDFQHPLSPRRLRTVVCTLLYAKVRDSIG